MTVEIEYERDGCTETIERDDYHTEKDGYVLGYDTESGRGKVLIPTERVVMVRD